MSTDTLNPADTSNDRPAISENKMGVAPIPKLLFSMSIPAICSMLLQAVYNVVDSIFVSRISEDALTAVTLVFPIQMLLIAVGVGTGVGLNSLIARKLGEKKFDIANSAASHGFLLIILNWIIFFLFGLFGSRPFYSWYADSPNMEGMVNMATSYGTVVLCASLFMFTQITCEKILQATGNMVMPMIANMLGCIINIILDPILIFGYLGAPKLGITGAAIATVIGQFFGMLCVMSFLFFKEHPVKVTFKNFKFSWHTIKDIYVVALPGMVMQAIPSFVTILLNMILISFSQTAVSVLGVYFRLQSFIFMPVFGLTQGAMPIMGYNYGARIRERLMHVTKLTLITAGTIMLIGMIIFQLFPAKLMSLFDASDDMLKMGVNAMRCLSLCFIPAAVGITFATFFQALGHGIYSLLVTLLRQVIVLLPSSWTLSKIIGVTGVWISYPFAEIFSLACSIVLFIHIYKHDIKLMPSANANAANSETMKISDAEAGIN